jgi:hypothetical protein
MLTASRYFYQAVVQTSHSFEVAPRNSDTLTKLIEISCVGLATAVRHIIVVVEVKQSQAVL